MFKIQYILNKDNNKANAFNKKSDYIKSKKSFNYNILKINKNKLLLTNKHKLNITLRILKDNTKEFSIKKEKLQIFIDKMNEYIKKHYDKLLQRHLKIIKTLQLLRQYYQFL